MDLYGFLGSAVLYLASDDIAKYYLQMDSASMPLKILAPSVFIVSVSSVLKGYFNGREKMRATANSQSVEQILKAIFTVIIVEFFGFISNKNTVIMVCGASVATTVSTLGNLFYLYANFLKIKKTVWVEVMSSSVHKTEGISKIIKKILKVVVPISLSTFLAASNKTIDALTVVRIAKDVIGETEAIKQYGVLTGKIETLISLPFAFNIAFSTTLIPSISGAIARRENKKAEDMIKISIIAAILIGLPCTMIMCLFSKQILSLLFPNADSGSFMLSLSSFSIILVVLTQTISGALHGLEKFKAPIIALGVGGIIKLILNIVLISIKEINVYGAIISNLISYLVTLIIMFVSLKNTIYLKLNVVKTIFKPIIVAIITGASAVLIYNELQIIINEKISTLISLLLGSCIYMFLIFISKILSKDEINFFFTGKGVTKNIKMQNNKTQ